MTRYDQITIEGKAYDLSHLDSFAFEFIVPEKDGKPAQVYTIEAEFSWHCFTRRVKAGEKAVEALIYRHGHEERLFDERRYHLSKRLPDIIRNLGSRKCYHADRGNYSKVEDLHDDDVRAEYAIFFRVSRREKRRGLTLVVESAYVLDRIPHPRARRPINFSVIVHNTATGKPIRRPK